MKRGYNELVGIQATFSKAVKRYRLTHLYRWQTNTVRQKTGSIRGFDLVRYSSVEELSQCLMEAYAPATLSIWRQSTKQNTELYLQFQVGVTPLDLGLPGRWEHGPEK